MTKSQMKWKPAVILLVIAIIGFYLMTPRRKSRPPEISPAPQKVPAVKQHSAQSITNIELIKFADKNPHQSVADPTMKTLIGKRCGQVLIRLVQKHPLKWIREDLGKNLEKGDLIWRVKIRKDPASRVLASLEWTQLQTGPVASLNLIMQVFLDPSISDEYKMLTLAHEYYHFVQLQADPTLRPIFKGTDEGDMSEESMRTVFRVELEAYLVTAKLAVQQGWEQEKEVAQLYKHQGWSAFVNHFTDQAFLSKSQFQSHRKLIEQLRQEAITKGELNIPLP